MLQQLGAWTCMNGNARRSALAVIHWYNVVWARTSHERRACSPDGQGHCWVWLAFRSLLGI